MAIRLLPEGVVNRIAAGEVIERPASVVKELVENALDAGATRIEITVEDGGRALVRVADDGAGMSRDELPLALARHATSKLADDDDLLAIATLGFRGEALPSIAAVSRLDMLSRQAGADSAFEIAVEAGEIGPVKPAARTRGTEVIVRDLFFATPARLKFLKSARAEMLAIGEVVDRLAMANPRVGFVLSADGRATRRFEPDLEPGGLARLAAIMGRGFADNAIPIEAEREGVRLAGFAGVPTEHRATAQHQYLFVNGRPVRDRLLQGAVRGAYQDLVAGGRHPMLALFLALDPHEVDVNVHPTKAEVRFRDAGLVRGLIVGALKTALAGAGHRASSSVSEAALGAFRPEGIGPRQLSLATHRSAPGAYPRSDAPPRGLYESAAAFQAPHEQPAPPVAAPAEDDEAEAAEAPLGHARAQVHGTYIVAQTADGLVIVDQHAAHERIVFERMKAALRNGGIKRQMLLVPEIVELEDSAIERIAERAGELAELGLVIERFGGRAVIVREVPALLGQADVKALVRDLADELAEFGDAVALKEKLGEVCATLACHSSIRAGRRLTQPEMDALLRLMEATPHAGQCNHGRPTYVELKLADIERLFGRR
ncbi:MAG: DNA mismatch repair endonuclease MutL [Alphaproteobacteria bacterium]